MNQTKVNKNEKRTDIKWELRVWGKKKVNQEWEGYFSIHKLVFNTDLNLYEPVKAVVESIPIEKIKIKEMVKKAERYGLEIKTYSWYMDNELEAECSKYIKIPEHIVNDIYRAIQNTLEALLYN